MKDMNISGVRLFVMMGRRTTPGLSNEILKANAYITFIWSRKILNYGTGFISEIIFGNFLLKLNATMN